MKILDIAIKDLLRTSRNATSWLFMFGLPIMVTGLFYFMFGRVASQEEFNLPRTKVVIANMDKGGPRLRVSKGAIPGIFSASTMSELVVAILFDEELAELIDPVQVENGEIARHLVDTRQAQVAIIIPDGFSRSFADPYSTSTIEFYQDPTLTLGPGVIESILNQFMDNLSSVKSAVTLTLDLSPEKGYRILDQVIQRYLADFSDGSRDLEDRMLMVQSPAKADRTESPMVGIIGPIMAGMMVFYSFYTGVSTSQSILREEEEHTLPRLFTTPTPQVTILAGKFLSVFITVIIQINVLLIFGHFVFSIQWGDLRAVALIMAGTVFSAAAFGVFVNSLLKNIKQSGVIFGGVLTFSGMLGMVRTFGGNNSNAALLGDTVALLVPQGWAVRGFVYSINAHPIADALLTFTALMVWSAIFFIIGVWRFSKRYD